MMRLLAFRVRDFRSVEDSGWIETEQVTAMIGTNESGKTNILVPLWKLNPAKGGQIDPIADYPRKRYNEIRVMREKPVFIEARFALSADLQERIGALLRLTDNGVSKTVVSRDFDGQYYIAFPDTETNIVTNRDVLLEESDCALSDIAAEADAQTARNLVLQNLPAFVYYSSYGNLDSEIYLPHVVENIKRNALAQKEQAKARTLRVLFDFVKLKPEEILEMGQDVTVPASLSLTAEQESEITQIASRKKERDILLQSASTDLTRRFREWWKQGEYRFRFAADGNHFRIWVSDDKRPEDIELESRSTGLQWFFSFYLVFLVESAASHHGAILLLDEPGLSLHPLAQNDLSVFFDGLANTNQLVYTTHSPFMIDAEHLDRARSVYTDKTGITQVSGDLRVRNDRPDQTKSVFAAYAALAMSTAEALLLGCQPVIVETASDQHYLSAIKTYLIGRGFLRPAREILFMPGGSVHGVKAVCALVTGSDEDLPFVLLDSNPAGMEFAAALKASLYQNDKNRVLTIADFLRVPGAEFEDLFPPKIVARIVDRYLAKPSDIAEDFTEVLNDNLAIVPQIEAYAAKYDLCLPANWKVDVSKRVKTAIMRSKEDPMRDASFHLKAWQRIFSAVHPQTNKPIAGSVMSS